MKTQNDKRFRLIESAAQLFLTMGISVTTLAKIAELAKVPLGNVYYYFKSKLSIILAVIEYRSKMLQELLDNINLDSTATTPKAKIKLLITKLLIDNETLIKVGDPIGSLCAELAKENAELNKAAINLMQILVSWVEDQFKQMGKNNQEAIQLAKHLIANIQGISLLALVFKDLPTLQTAVNFISNSIDSL